MRRNTKKNIKKTIAKAGTVALAIGMNMSLLMSGSGSSYTGTVVVQAAEYNSEYSLMVGQCIADFDLSEYYNLTPPSYNTYYPWECVWYASGRAEEKAGHKISQIRGLGNANLWYNRTTLETGSEIRSNSILCYGSTATNQYGHVVYIECVQGDTVYYTEANVDGGKSDQLRSPSDGVLKKSTIEKLEAPANFQGYIYLDGIIDGELLLGNDDQWHVYKDGVINTEYTGMARNQYGWWYVVDGNIDLNYTGIGENDYGTWYFEDGVIAWDYTGMFFADDDWWYCNNGLVDTEYTGMALNEHGWWYYTDGNIDWEYTGMALNEYGWWYFKDGVIDFNYTGMAENKYGWWYFKDGNIDWDYTGEAENEYGSWYFKDGIIDFDYVASDDEDK
jgi:hypothetical protein